MALAGIRTPPHELVLSLAASAAAIGPLVDDGWHTIPHLSGVVGPA